MFFPSEDSRKYRLFLRLMGSFFFFFFPRRISNICWHPQAERQIFFQFKKHMLLSLSKKKTQTKKNPSSKAIEEGLFAIFFLNSAEKSIQK